MTIAVDLGRKATKQKKTSQKCQYVSIPWLGLGGRNGEERYPFQLPERQTDCDHIQYLVNSHEIF